MTAHPKTLVVQYIAQTTRRNPTPDPQFLAEKNATTCRLQLMVDGTGYDGVGVALRKKQAEVIAYGDILRQMVANGLCVPDAAEALAYVDDLVAQEQAAVEAASQQETVGESRLRKAFATLCRPYGDNHVWHLQLFAQTAGIREAVYTQHQTGESTWEVNVSIVLPGAPLRSDTYTGSKKSCRQRAASDLIARIKEHMQQ
ncbi:MAG TPA: hypothetical protein VFO38_05090 [Candidatus Saccharimonadales bacterium]|nr:hypothetical protein [Candidatus Saccharimonadales bacterium]